VSARVPGISFAEWGPGDNGMWLGYANNHDEPYPADMWAVFTDQYLPEDPAVKLLFQHGDIKLKRALKDAFSAGRLLGEQHAGKIRQLKLRFISHLAQLFRDINRKATKLSKWFTLRQMLSGSSNSSIMRYRKMAFCFWGVPNR
jgi:hypothetical protein